MANTHFAQLRAVSNPFQELGKYSQLKTSHLMLTLEHEQESSPCLQWGKVLE